MRADLQELIDARVAAEHHPVSNFHMAGDADVVGENGMIPDDAVVRHVHIGHQQVVAANARVVAAHRCAPVQGTAFANDVVVADLQPGLLAGELLVSRVLTHGSELVDSVVLADPRIRLDHHVRTDLGTLTDFDSGADDRPGAHGNIRSQPRRRIDYCTFINQVTFLSAHMIIAVPTSSPSTEALQSNL